MRSIHYLYPGHGAYEYQVRINSSYNMSFSLDFRRHRIHTAEKIMKRAFEAPGSVTWIHTGAPTSQPLLNKNAMTYSASTRLIRKNDTASITAASSAQTLTQPHIEPHDQYEPLPPAALKTDATSI